MSVVVITTIVSQSSSPQLTKSFSGFPLLIGRFLS
nr:MAG TPA: hypothetical protein [Caudoviricetes sp.]DAS61537.1 MAG TPA: hypothetical protein [Caudoviricetes sp.]DAW46193.1 MAG TPA: hypothetical protein [Bacteriophage sp.]